jgi:hypothetical protein
VEVLEELGFLERVESRRRRGAKEHFFRAKATLLIDDSNWWKVPASVRSDLLVSDIQLLLDDIVGALHGGVFASRTGSHVTWLPGIFDKLGWQECMGLMNGTLARMRETQERSRERLAVSGEPGIPATVALVAFGTPPAANQPGG